MKKSIKIISQIIISVIIPISSFITSIFLSDKFKGRNYSDVGIPMYTNSNFVFFIGILIYIILIGIIFFVIKFAIFKKEKLIIYVGIPISIIFFSILIPILAFSYL